jgi:tRNA nucleotidyltransferase (CCA-adding enzyme)
MKVYLVGGAVRDQLLAQPPGERDWVVVGATPAQLQAQGYRQVGRDFPVFLHPETGEEYALARLERKIGPGYRGFVTEHLPTVTLEDDLRRRDLTINAIAQAADGTLLDPHGGQRDLAARLLRHVSAAFVEDPVRVLRVARFAARFAPLGFQVAPDTLALMRRMVAAGELAALVPERVWRELARALESARPGVFFSVLQDCGALGVVLPEVAALLADPAHGASALAALQAAANAEASATVRWAALLAALPLAAQRALHERLRAPAEFAELATLATRLRQQLQDTGGARALLASPSAQVELLEAADAWRRPERFAQWLEVLAACGPSADAAPAELLQLQSALRRAQQLTAAVRLEATQLSQLQGAAIGAAIRERRIQVLR